MSPGRPAPRKLLSMSLSTQGLTSFVVFICSPLGGLSQDAQQAAYTCLAGGWPRGSGRGEERAASCPGFRCAPTSGCQMTVAAAASGTGDGARGMARLPPARMRSGLPERCASPPPGGCRGCCCCRGLGWLAAREAQEARKRHCGTPPRAGTSREHREAWEVCCVCPTEFRPARAAQA